MIIFTNFSTNVSLLRKDAPNIVFFYPKKVTNVATRIKSICSISSINHTSPESPRLNLAKKLSNLDKKTILPSGKIPSFLESFP